MQIENWPVSKLVPYGRNPRKNDHAVKRMAASIREFGFKISDTGARQWRDSRWPSALESRAGDLHGRGSRHSV